MIPSSSRQRKSMRSYSQRRSMEELSDVPNSRDHNILGGGNHELEIFKLDEIDRRVFFWLVGHENLRKSLPSWLEYICIDYKRRQGVSVNVARILNEVCMIEPRKNVSCRK